MAYETYEPRGTKFFDRRRQLHMMLVHDGQPWAGWIAYRNGGGKWVSLRKATDEDIAAINRAMGVLTIQENA